MPKSSLNMFYGSQEQLRRYHQGYLSRLLPQRPELPVLDLGCGFGAFMELVRDQGLDVIGVDCVDDAVDSCRSRGFDVFKDNVHHFLEDKRGAYSAVFCSHLIEHFAYDDACRLLKMIAAALAHGGRTVVITPNPASLEVAEYFWLDPTHVRPYPLQLLSRMVEDSGLTIIDSGRQSPSGQPRRDIPRRLLLKMVLGRHYGALDSFVVAEKAK
ncbi:MAG: class I SAM-dependent methyltransferase [Thermoleophilia bacterium]